MTDASSSTSTGPTRDYYFTHEVGYLLGISTQQVERMIALGGLEARKVPLDRAPGWAWGIGIEAFHAYYPNLIRLDLTASRDRRPWYRLRSSEDAP